MQTDIPSSVPVLPLGYYSGSSDTWPVVVRIVSWGSMALGILLICSGLIPLLEKFASSMKITSTRYTVDAVYIVLNTMFIGIGLLMLLSAIGGMRLYPLARRLLILSNILLMGTFMIGTVINLWNWGIQITGVDWFFSMANMLLWNAELMILPVMVMVLLTRRGAKEIFLSRAAA